MFIKKKFMLLCILIILSSFVCCTGISKVRVNQISQNYEVYDPGKKLVLTIPEDGFTVKDLRDENLRAYEPSPSFFYLENRESGLVISIWFGPEDIFPGMNRFWDDEINGYKRAGLPSPQNVSFNKIGAWETITYDMDYPGYTKSYTKANLVQKGVWVEMILSIPSGSTNDKAKAKLIDTLKTIQVKENR
jgi:hypothetical protein